MLYVVSVSLAGCGFLAWKFVHERGGLTAVEAYSYSSVLVACALYLAYALRTHLASSVILTEDAIEFVGLLQRDHRRLTRDQIAGWRFQAATPTSEGRTLSLLTLIPANPGEKPLKIRMMYDTDSIFRDWIIEFPDLDSEEPGSSIPRSIGPERVDENLVAILQRRSRQKLWDMSQ